MSEEAAKSSRPAPAKDQIDPDKRGCRAFRTLKNWQTSMYRIAVNENRWYMGERLGRQVDWEEAERDFLHNGYYGCASKWRQHFCASKCTHFSTCDLARLFCPDD